MIILDTNVLSELLRREPAIEVLNNMRKLPPGDLFTTAVTEAEIRLGAAILPAGKRRQALQMQVELVLQEDFAGRILPFDSDAARAYAKLVAERRAAGRPISQSDAEIAAIAQIHGAILATRNERGFRDCRLQVINPFREL